MAIEAMTPSGTLTIQATEQFTRRYSWSSYQKTFTLSPRLKRWYGSNGIYRPVGDEDMHAVLEEGQQHFYSEPEALAWLAWQQDRMRWTYTSDGLVVGWYQMESKRSQERSRTFVAQVWQLYIQGRKPNALQGARDAQIHVRTSGSQAPAPGTQVLSQPTTINNRWFAGKAIDYMKEFDISAAQVEDVITRAKKIARGSYFWQHGWDVKPMMKLSVCTDASGKVWLVVR